MNLFANVIPVQKLAIPWGWRNVRKGGFVFATDPPGRIVMPDLPKFFDWSQYIVEDMSLGLPFGTRNMKSIFQTASRFLGWEVLFLDKPDLTPITEGYLKWNRRLAADWDGRLKWFMLGDDVAHNNGLFMSPESFRKWIIPEHKRLIDFAHAEGMKVIMHSDGDLYDVLPDYESMGVEALCYQSIGRMQEVTSLPLVVARGLTGHLWGNMLCFENVDVDRPNTNMMRMQE